MPNNVKTTQGQCWDQIALERLGSEKAMNDIIQANPDEIDTLVFAGEVSLAVPVVEMPVKKSLPPWERM